MEKVFGNSPDIQFANPRHDGAKGDWLHLQFGQEKDSKNTADFWGYECKNFTQQRTTWGDWTANYYIFEDKDINITRGEFLRIFGKKNLEKQNRLSWSGSHVPSFNNQVTNFGQSMIVDYKKDISIFYNFHEDLREDKFNLIPMKFRKKNILLAKWYGYKRNNPSRKTSLEEKVNNKFNQKGFFKCHMQNGKYDKILFGEPMNFDNWIKNVEEGYIFFDSGMYEGNRRPYSNWRSDNKFWDALLKEVYPKTSL